MELSIYHELFSAVEDEDYAAIDKLLKTRCVDVNSFNGKAFHHAIFVDDIFLMSFMLNHETQKVTQQTVKRIYNLALRHDKMNILNVINAYIKLKPRETSHSNSDGSE